MQQKTSPLMLKIVEDWETTDILGSLKVIPLELKIGDEWQIGYRRYRVDTLRDEQGNLLRGSKYNLRDLRDNLRAFIELKRIGVIPESFVLNELCLRNPDNGNALVELLVPELTDCSSNSDLMTPNSKRSFFVRFDSSAINPNLKKSPIEFTRVVFTTCMFGTDFANVITESGRKVPITERHSRQSVVDGRAVKLLIHSQLSLYEREAIKRLTSIVKLLTYNGKVDAITTAFPRGAYYSFLLDDLEDGWVSPSMVLQWFDEVDQRVQILQDIVHQDLQSACPHIPINQYSFMDVTCDTMRGYVERIHQNPQQAFDREELLQLCLDAIIEHDPLGGLLEQAGLLNFQTFQEMADFTYAVSNLIDMAEKQQGWVSTKQIIGVYDVTENILWNVMRKLRKNGLLKFKGLYDEVKPERSPLDNLSYVAVMPIEHIAFDLSPEFVDNYMGGYQKLYALRKGALPDKEEEQLYQIL